MIKKTYNNIINKYTFLFLLVVSMPEFQPVCIFKIYCNASMGTMTVKGIDAEIVSSSDKITISRTTINSLANQERTISINDVSGIMVVTGFSNIATSTTLNSNHNGVILVSGNIILTLPDPASVLGIRYTIKKVDSQNNIVTISGIVDNEINPQLSEQNSYITIISNGNAWYKVAECSAVSENQTYIINSIGMTFRLIPAGTFVMGSSIDELGRNFNETQYTATISKPFYIQTTEVTQGQWEAIMGNNPSSFTDCGHNCPVESISWEDAKIFIDTLNAMGDGSYTLPTEAQWEYAARSGSNKAFTNGDITNITTDPNLDVMGWYYSNAASTTHAVAQKQANAWGLFDMHGNVYEWCHDWYGNSPTGYVTDPVGPSSGTDRVFRDCHWGDSAKWCRSATRDGYAPGTRYNGLGLRLLRTID